VIVNELMLSYVSACVAFKMMLSYVSACVAFKRKEWTIEMSYL